MDQLRSWLKERYQLAVAVYSTPAAEAVLAKSGLTVTDFLRPLSLVNKLNVPMRVGEISYRIQEIKLALYAGNTMFQPKPEVIDERLKELLALQAQQHAQLQPMTDLIRHVQSESPEALTPWFHSYQAEFLRLVKFTEHERLDHPMAGLFFIPANTEHPLQAAEKLMMPEQQPPLMASSSEVMMSVKDPLFAKHFVLLQDVAGGMDEGRALANLATLSNTYRAANCSILRLHSGGGGGGGGSRATDAVPASVFQACRHANLPGGGAGEPQQRPPEPPGGLGSGLCSEDMAAAAALLKDFCERCLLPKVEEHIARLNFGIKAEVHLASEPFTTDVLTLRTYNCVLPASLLVRLLLGAMVDIHQVTLDCPVIPPIWKLFGAANKLPAGNAASMPPAYKIYDELIARLQAGFTSGNYALHPVSLPKAGFKFKASVQAAAGNGNCQPGWCPCQFDNSICGPCGQVTFDCPVIPPIWKLFGASGTNEVSVPPDAYKIYDEIIERWQAHFTTGNFALHPISEPETAAFYNN
eukprot:gene9635-9795_t